MKKNIYFLTFLSLTFFSLYIVPEYYSSNLVADDDYSSPSYETTITDNPSTSSNENATETTTTAFDNVSSGNPDGFNVDNNVVSISGDISPGAVTFDYAASGMHIEPNTPGDLSSGMTVTGPEGTTGSVSSNEDGTYTVSFSVQSDTSPDISETISYEITPDNLGDQNNPQDGFTFIIDDPDQPPGPGIDGPTPVLSASAECVTFRPIVHLSWSNTPITGPSGPGSVRWVVVRSGVSGALAIKQANELSADDTTVTQQTLYFYRVYSYDSASDKRSPLSNIMAVSTPSCSLSGYVYKDIDKNGVCAPLDSTYGSAGGGDGVGVLGVEEDGSSDGGGDAGVYTEPVSCGEPGIGGETVQIIRAPYMEPGACVTLTDSEGQPIGEDCGPDIPQPAKVMWSGVTDEEGGYRIFGIQLPYYTRYGATQLDFAYTVRHARDPLLPGWIRVNPTVAEVALPMGANPTVSYGLYSPPPAPGAFSQNTPVATCVGVNSPKIRLEWNPSAGATSYRVSYTTPQGGTTPLTLPNPAQTFLDITSGLTPGQSYGFIVYAANGIAPDASSNNGTWSQSLPGGTWTTYLNCAAPTFDFNITYTDINGQTQTAPANTTPAYPTTTTGRTVTLGWKDPINIIPANNCTATGWSFGSTIAFPGSSVQGPYNNPPDDSKQYFLACINNNLPPAVRTTTKNIILNIKGVKPFIQTRGGDVHTNQSIDIPGN